MELSLPYCFMSQESLGTRTVQQGGFLAVRIKMTWEEHGGGEGWLYFFWFGDHFQKLGWVFLGKF